MDRARLDRVVDHRESLEAVEHELKRGCVLLAVVVAQDVERPSGRVERVGVRRLGVALAKRPLVFTVAHRARDDQAPVATVQLAHPRRHQRQDLERLGPQCPVEGPVGVELRRDLAELIADDVAELITIGQGSEVAILQGIITQSTGQARAQGSKAGLEACGLKVVAEQPADWDRAKGQSVMENILTGNPNIKAVFASNDNMALGAVEALKAADKLKDVIVVGFDANPDAAASVLAGEMSATVAQAPKNMGALGVESVLKLKKGETLPPNIDTGTVLVTKENAEQYK